MIKDCPQPTREIRKTADTLVPASVFALTETEATDDKTLTAGEFFLLLAFYALCNCVGVEKDELVD